MVESQQDTLHVSLKHTLKRRMDVVFSLVKNGEYGTIAQRFLTLLKTTLKPSRAPWDSVEYYHAFTDQVYVVENFNDENTKRILAKLKPDLLVLGGSRILKQHILSIPTVGVLNAHPGLLPMYRGVDVIPWAILNGESIGVTVHFVDSGVDTGSIILQKELTITKRDSIESLRTKARDLSADLMVKCINSIGADVVKTIPQGRGEGKRYYRMTGPQYKMARRKLRRIQRDMP